MDYMSSKMDRTTTPGNIWDRIIFLERQLKFLAENTPTPITNPSGGEGDIIYNVGASEESVLNVIKLILRFSGTELYAYSNSDSGMAAAIAATSAGDTILLPTCNLVNDYTIPANVTIVGRTIEDCIYTGQITLSDGSALENLSIIRSEDEVGAIYGIVEGAGAIEAEMKDVRIDVANATGPAYGVFMENAGVLRAFNTEILAETGSVGYSVYTTGGDFYHYSGRAIGTVALTPYFA